MNNKKKIKRIERQLQRQQSINTELEVKLTGISNQCEALVRTMNLMSASLVQAQDAIAAIVQTMQGEDPVDTSGHSDNPDDEFIDEMGG